MTKVGTLAILWNIAYYISVCCVSLCLFFHSHSIITAMVFRFTWLRDRMNIYTTMSLSLCLSSAKRKSTNFIVDSKFVFVLFVFVFIIFFRSHSSVNPWNEEDLSLLCENRKDSHVCSGHFYTRPHHNYLVCMLLQRPIYLQFMAFILINFYVFCVW